MKLIIRNTETQFVFLLLVLFFFSICISNAQSARKKDDKYRTLIEVISINPKVKVEFEMYIVINGKKSKVVRNSTPFKKYFNWKNMEIYFHKKKGNANIIYNLYKIDKDNKKVGNVSSTRPNVAAIINSSGFSIKFIN